MAKKNEETPNGGDAILNIGVNTLIKNPEWLEVHITSDGYGFGSDADAKNHAKGLLNKTVTKVIRAQIGSVPMLGGETSSGVVPRPGGGTPGGNDL